MSDDIGVVLLVMYNGLVLVPVAAHVKGCSRYHCTGENTFLPLIACVCCELTQCLHFYVFNDCWSDR